MNTTLERLDAAISDAKAKLERLLSARAVLTEFEPTNDSVSAAPAPRPALPPASAAPPCACGSHTHDESPAADRAPLFDETDVCRVRVLKVLTALGPLSFTPLQRQTGTNVRTLRDALESMSAGGHVRKVGVTWEVTDAGRNFTPSKPSVVPTWQKVLDALERRGPMTAGEIMRHCELTQSATEKAISRLHTAERIEKVNRLLGTRSPWALAGAVAAPAAEPTPAPRPADLRTNRLLDDAFDPQPPPSPGKVPAFAPAAVAAKAGMTPTAVKVLDMLAASARTFSELRDTTGANDNLMGRTLRFLKAHDLIRKSDETNQRSPWELVPQTAEVG
ncbi:MAG TPA: helix-turn-helix domain-containing protein [Urbifossiella sp.]|nr:helix-turn-helix domain-containing protein [Urbifossiella sp.]